MNVGQPPVAQTTKAIPAFFGNNSAQSPAPLASTPQPGLAPHTAVGTAPTGPSTVAQTTAAIPSFFGNTSAQVPAPVPTTPQSTLAPHTEASSNLLARMSGLGSSPVAQTTAAESPAAQTPAIPSFFGSINAQAPAPVESTPKGFTPFSVSPAVQHLAPATPFTAGAAAPAATSSPLPLAQRISQPAVQHGIQPASQSGPSALVVGAPARLDASSLTMSFADLAKRKADADAEASVAAQKAAGTYVSTEIWQLALRHYNEQGLNDDNLGQGEQHALARLLLMPGDYNAAMANPLARKLPEPTEEENAWAKGELQNNYPDHDPVKFYALGITILSATPATLDQEEKKQAAVEGAARKRAEKAAAANNAVAANDTPAANGAPAANDTPAANGAPAAPNRPAPTRPRQDLASRAMHNSNQPLGPLTPRPTGRKPLTGYGATASGSTSPPSTPPTPTPSSSRQGAPAQPFPRGGQAAPLGKAPPSWDKPNWLRKPPVHADSARGGTTSSTGSRVFTVEVDMADGGDKNKASDEDDDMGESGAMKPDRRVASSSTATLPQAQPSSGSFTQVQPSASNPPQAGPPTNFFPLAATQPAAPAGTFGQPSFGAVPNAHASSSRQVNPEASSSTAPAQVQQTTGLSPEALATLAKIGKTPVPARTAILAKIFSTVAGSSAYFNLPPTPAQPPAAATNQTWGSSQAGPSTSTATNGWASSRGTNARSAPTRIENDFSLSASSSGADQPDDNMDGKGQEEQNGEGDDDMDGKGGEKQADQADQDMDDVQSSSAGTQSAPPATSSGGLSQQVHALPTPPSTPFAPSASTAQPGPTATTTATPIVSAFANFPARPPTYTPPTPPPAPTAPTAATPVVSAFASFPARAPTYAPPPPPQPVPTAPTTAAATVSAFAAFPAKPPTYTPPPPQPPQPPAPTAPATATPIVSAFANFPARAPAYTPAPPPYTPAATPAAPPPASKPAWTPPTASKPTWTPPTGSSTSRATNPNSPFGSGFGGGTTASTSQAGQATAASPAIAANKPQPFAARIGPPSPPVPRRPLTAPAGWTPPPPPQWNGAFPGRSPAPPAGASSSSPAPPSAPLGTSPTPASAPPKGVPNALFQKAVAGLGMKGGRMVEASEGQTIRFGGVGSSSTGPPPQASGAAGPSRRSPLGASSTTPETIRAAAAAAVVEGAAPIVEQRKRDRGDITPPASPTLAWQQVSDPYGPSSSHPRPSKTRIGGRGQGQQVPLALQSTAPATPAGSTEPAAPQPVLPPSPPASVVSSTETPTAQSAAESYPYDPAQKALRVRSAPDPDAEEENEDGAGTARKKATGARKSPDTLEHEFRGDLPGPQ
ncbi:hypothetical protein Q8F55_008642 [Vanrija albida]|uniref:Uncharacterized protein n=1 Tax=Vanrija albida TaxID=181172 RepID=A0ABR3PRG7_9TREE